MSSFPNTVDEAHARERRHLDDAACLPSLYLILSGVAWLMLAGGVSTLAALKLVFPTFLSSCSYVTYGKLAVFADVSLKWGFVSQTGLGVGLWILSRCTRKALVGGGLISVANVFWNIALTLGVGGILFGDSTGLSGLELPRYAAPLLWVSLICISTWAVLTYQLRDEREATPALAWVLGALFWISWAYGTALVLGVLSPGRGLLPVMVAAWFQGIFAHLWAGSLALAALFYFVPTVRQKALAQPGMALLGFWGWAFVGAWTGASHLIGGPVPAWMATTGVVAAVLLLLPAVLLSMSLWPTFRGGRRSIGSGFLAMATFLLPIVVLGQAVNSLRGVSVITHFTLRDLAFDSLYFQGFIGFALFGAVYEIVPRLLGRLWPQPLLAKAHLGLTLLGLAVSFGSLWIAGVQQGRMQNIGLTTPMEAMALAKPWLLLRILGLLAVGAGQAAFLANFGLLVKDIVAPRVPQFLAWAGIELPVRKPVTVKS